MRVAVAGAGDLALYFCEELPSAGHELCLLSRKRRPELHQKWPNITQIETDYSLESLSFALADVDVLISTIVADGQAFIDVHGTLIQACRKSQRCKRFIPSEFAGNAEVYPDLPLYYFTTRQPVRELLNKQDDLEWTIISCGWFADYLVPSENRYLKDVAAACPIDITEHRIVVPASGEEPITLTWARDVTKSIASLLDAAPGSWEKHTYLSCEQTTWNNVSSLVKELHPHNFFHETRATYFDIVTRLKQSDDKDAVYVADLQLWSAIGASSLPREKILAQRRKYFSTVKFRSLREGMEESHKHPGGIII